MYLHGFSTRVSRAVMMSVVVVLMSLLLGPMSYVVVGAPARANEVVIAQGADATTLDPQKQSDTDTGNVCMSIFDTMLLRDKNMEIQPALATDYKRISATEWELNLRRDVTFHNGEPFNADAVKFTFDRVKDPATKALAASYFSTISECTVVGPYTVRFTTNAPDPIFLARMTNMFIVPPKYIKEKGDDYFSRNPVGTGPFRFVQWIRDDRVVVEANENYFRGKPAVSRLVWKAVPEMATRIAGLQSGEIDLVQSIPADQVGVLKASRDVSLLTTPSAQLQMVNFNISVAPGDNKNFRLAVAHAIDPRPIVAGLLDGYAAVIDAPISNVIPNAPTTVKRLAYDPVKAKEYLAKAGYPSGISIDMVCQNGKYPMDKEIAQVIAQQLAQVGIKVNLKPTEYGQFQTILKNKTISPVYVSGGNNVWFDTDPQITAFYGTGGALSTYSNPALDELIEKGRTSMDAKERVSTYEKTYALVRDEAAGIGLFQYTVVSATSSRLNWSARPDARIWAYDISFK
jgi:peptide/nickel transport system substrate-binding protein